MRSEHRDTNMKMAIPSVAIIRFPHCSIRFPIPADRICSTHGWKSTVLYPKSWDLSMYSRYMVTCTTSPETWIQNELWSPRTGRESMSITSTEEGDSKASTMPSKRVHDVDIMCEARRRCRRRERRPPCTCRRGKKCSGLKSTSLSAGGRS